jgi:hypothetical protein
VVVVEAHPSEASRLVNLADEMDQKWKCLRSCVLHELDRECPEHLDSPYVKFLASNIPLQQSGAPQ